MLELRVWPKQLGDPTKAETWAFHAYLTTFADCKENDIDHYLQSLATRFLDAHHLSGGWSRPLLTSVGRALIIIVIVTAIFPPRSDWDAGIHKCTSQSYSRSVCLPIEYCLCCFQPASWLRMATIESRSSNLRWIPGRMSQTHRLIDKWNWGEPEWAPHKRHSCAWSIYFIEYKQRFLQKRIQTGCLMIFMSF